MDTHVNDNITAPEKPGTVYTLGWLEGHSSLSVPNASVREYPGVRITSCTQDTDSWWDVFYAYDIVANTHLEAVEKAEAFVDDFTPFYLIDWNLHLGDEMIAQADGMATLAFDRGQELHQKHKHG